MSEHTQRWMKRELQQLLAQRARYVQAETASSDVRQKVHHTTQRLRLDEEIQGRREALHALAHRAAPRPADPRRTEAERLLTRPRASSPSSVHHVDRSTPILAVGVCVATFALGFVLMDTVMSSDRSASPTTPEMVQRYRPLGPATPIRVSKQPVEPVMAASARTPERRR